MPVQSKERLYPVWEAIERDIESQLGLNQLAFLSNFSPWHFHRFFKKQLSENVQDYIKRLRIEKAAYELKISNLPIIEIALEAGYESQEAFTKAFKRYMLDTPSSFRKKFKTSKKNLKTDKLFHTKGLELGLDFNEVRYKFIASFEMAFTRHFGPYENLPGPLPNSKEVLKLLDFVNFIKSNPANHKWLGVSLDDPTLSRPEKLRFDLGITIGSRYKNFPEIGYKKIESGKYIIFRARCPFKNLPKIYQTIQDDYFAVQKVQLMNQPPFEMYINPFPQKKEVPIVDIYFGVKN